MRQNCFRVPGRILAGVLLMVASRSLAITNDDCGTAEALTPGATCIMAMASWTDATQSLAPILCSGSTGVSANDAWFSFVATSEHSIVSVQSDSSNDAILELFSGDCASLLSIACADATLDGGLESATVNTTVGITYYIRTYWWDYGAPPASLAFSICVQEGPPSPTNDDCSSVVPVDLAIGSSLSFAGTTVGADTTGDYTAGSELAGAEPSVWHAFTLAECAHVSVSYCGTLPAFGDTWGVLASSCPAAAAVYASGFDLSSCADGNATLFFDSLPAGTWYLPVLSNEEADGPYTLEVSATTCATGTPEIPSAAAWAVSIENGWLRLRPGSTGRALVEVMGSDGRLFRSWTLDGVMGSWVQLDLSGAPRQVLFVALSTTHGRQIVRLLP